jgi:hypothetical protein
VVIKEKEIEDLICRRPSCILPEGAVILGRQIPLAHGRLDVLAWNYGITYVIELKARPLQEKDIGQVLRYTHDVKRHLFVAFHNAIRQDPHFELESWRGNTYADALMPFANAVPDEFPAIQPMLIGSAAGSSVMAAAGGACIEVLVWSANEEKLEMSFSHVPFHESIDAALHSTPDWASNVVAKAQRLALEHTDWHIDRAIESLFE